MDENQRKINREYIHQLWQEGDPDCFPMESIPVMPEGTALSLATSDEEIRLRTLSFKRVTADPSVWPKLSAEEIKAMLESTAEAMRQRRAALRLTGGGKTNAMEGLVRRVQYGEIDPSLIVIMDGVDAVDYGGYDSSDAEA